MSMQALIAARRDGLPHSQADLSFLAQGAADGSIPDYQLSAWLMAAYLKPLSIEETTWLTVAMADSGERMDLTGLPKPWLDKHSTGGVGDKTSLVVLPLLAACGITIVKMSGRGLGITGGTVDKLGSIPGFRLDLTPAEMKEQAGRIGIALTGQSPNLAPADKVLYALRDSTATVASMPLIASSILSKKIAGGAENVVLDIKAGEGSFMPTLADAQELARWLTTVGTSAGLKVTTVLSDMNQPLGSAVGNALEVREALAVLKGENMTPALKRFRLLCTTIVGLALNAVGIAPTSEIGRAQARKALDRGEAYDKAIEWITAQGGDIEALPKAPVVAEVRANQSGNVSRVSARTVGEVVMALGGGRQKKDDLIDPSVGVLTHVMVGDTVAQGDLLFTIHASNNQAVAEATQQLTGAVTVVHEAVQALTLFHGG